MRNHNPMPGSRYLTRSINGRAQTNVGYNEKAEEFMPRAYGVESGQSDD
ncbi:hypothetical protein N5V57_20835 [Escherichia coli]|nr:hypothetical protein [Escherichia coli]MCT7387728.1 hypothetical protein [Escherichia coli]